MEYVMTNLRNTNKFVNLNRNLKIEIISYLIHNEKVNGFINANKKIRKEMKNKIGNPFKVANYLGYLKGNVYLTNKGYFNFIGDYPLFETLLTKFSNLKLEEILQGCEIYISDSLNFNKNKIIKFLLTLSDAKENDFYSQLLDLPEMEKNKEFICFTLQNKKLIYDEDLGILKKINVVKLDSGLFGEDEELYDTFFNYLIKNKLRIRFKSLLILEMPEFPYVLEYFKVFPNQLEKYKLHQEPSEIECDLILRNSRSLNKIIIKEYHLSDFENLIESLKNNLSSGLKSEELKAVLSKTFIEEVLSVESDTNVEELKKQIEDDQLYLHKWILFEFSQKSESDLLVKTLEQFEHTNLFRLKLYFNSDFMNVNDFQKLPLLLGKYPKLENVELDGASCRHEFKLGTIFIVSMNEEFNLSKEWVLLIHQLMKNQNSKTDIIDVTVSGSLKYFQEFINFTQIHNPTLLQKYKFNIKVKGKIDNFSLKNVKINHLSLLDFETWSLFENINEVISVKIEMEANLGDEKFLKFLNEKKVKFLKVTRLGGITKLKVMTAINYLSSISMFELGEVYMNEKASELIIALALTERVQHISFNSRRNEEIDSALTNNPKIKYIRPQRVYARSLRK